MDPEACSQCGRWIRRCQCAGAGVEETSSVIVTLASLPAEIATMVWQRCTLEALGRVSCTSKRYREQLYAPEVWQALVAMAPAWASGFDLGAGSAAASLRLAARHELELERAWRHGRWFTAAIPIHRCRAHEKMDEVVGADLLPGNRLLVVGLRPPTLQIWSGRSPHVMTHCLRGRERVDAFYCLLLPAPRGSAASAGRALSQDRRRERATLWLWNVPAARGHRHRSGGAEEAPCAPLPLKLSTHSKRVCAAAYCAETMTLATASEDGVLLVWSLELDEPSY